MPVVILYIFSRFCSRGFKGWISMWRGITSKHIMVRRSKEKDKKNEAYEKPSNLTSSRGLYFAPVIHFPEWVSLPSPHLPALTLLGLPRQTNDLPSTPTTRLNSRYTSRIIFLHLGTREHAGPCFDIFLETSSLSQILCLTMMISIQYRTNVANGTVNTNTYTQECQDKEQMEAVK